ncbi:MAG: hypothetical protein ABGZ23_15925 [Fuerstiella sp.]
MNNNANQGGNDIAPTPERQSAADIGTMQDGPAALQWHQTGYGIETWFFERLSHEKSPIGGSWPTIPR